MKKNTINTYTNLTTMQKEEEEMNTMALQEKSNIISFSKKWGKKDCFARLSNRVGDRYTDEEMADIVALSENCTEVEEFNKRWKK